VEVLFSLSLCAAPTPRQRDRQTLLTSNRRISAAYAPGRVLALDDRRSQSQVPRAARLLSHASTITPSRRIPPASRRPARRPGIGLRRKPVATSSTSVSHSGSLPTDLLRHTIRRPRTSRTHQVRRTVLRIRQRGRAGEVRGQCAASRRDVPAVDDRHAREWRSRRSSAAQSIMAFDLPCRAASRRSNRWA